MRRSRSRSPPQSFSSNDEDRQPKRPLRMGRSSNFTSNFSTQATSQAQQSTAEILNQYKAQNPNNQNIISQNKSERQLYIGNIPQNINTNKLMDLLNKTLKELGEPVGLFQNGDPILGCWIAGDGHYAFVDIRSAEEATEAFVLNQVQIQGQYLKVGRPKNSTGPLPTPSELRCGNQSFVSQNTTKKKATSAGIVQQALRQGNVIKWGVDEAQQAMNCRIKVLNFPQGHSEEEIRKICEIFGNIKTIDFVYDYSKRFTGIVNVEFFNELEAKRAQSGMMGLKINDCILDVKKISASEIHPSSAADGEVFKQLIEDKPTCCLCLKNIVLESEIESRIDYKELEFDVEDEMKRFGNVVRVVVPRPPLFSDPYSMPGFGRVYIRFREVQEAMRAKEKLVLRRFNGRAAEIQYYPEERFAKGIWG